LWKEVFPPEAFLTVRREPRAAPGVEFVQLLMHLPRFACTLLHFRRVGGIVAFVRRQPPGNWGSSEVSVRDFGSVVRSVFVATAFVLGAASVGHAGSSLDGFYPWHPPTHPRQAPEIDPASATAGLAMLAGGVMVVRGRRRS
jgi:hypothetical protein